jgi:hypothetical protein
VPGRLYPITVQYMVDNSADARAQRRSNEERREMAAKGFKHRTIERIDPAPYLRWTPIAPYRSSKGKAHTNRISFPRALGFLVSSFCNLPDGSLCPLRLVVVEHVQVLQMLCNMLAKMTQGEANPEALHNHHPPPILTSIFPDGK